jgi:hypothetical protein
MMAGSPLAFAVSAMVCPNALRVALSARFQFPIRGY